MEETKMKIAKHNEVDPWLMDDTVPYDPSLMEGFVAPKEMEEAFNKIIDEIADEYAVVSAA